MERRQRRQRLEELQQRATPWTNEQWREWAAVAAADILDRGEAFAVGHNPGRPRQSSVIVVGPFGDPTRRELGGRAARAFDGEEVRL